MFTGFRPEAIDFLWQLRFNNNKTWFEAHKEQYLNDLYRPMRAFSEELFDPFRAIPTMHCAVSRIYRDTRIPQPVPYKDHLWICIRHKESTIYWGEQPTLFFEIWPDSFGYGLVFWAPRAPVMERFRKQVALQPGSFAEMIARAEEQTGFAFGGDSYKRPKPCPDASLERFYRQKNFLMYGSFPISEALYAPDLADTVRGSLLALLPVFSFLQNLTK